MIDIPINTPYWHNLLPERLSQQPELLQKMNEYAALGGSGFDFKRVYKQVEPRTGNTIYLSETVSIFKHFQNSLKSSTGDHYLFSHWECNVWHLHPHTQYVEGTGPTPYDALMEAVLGYSAPFAHLL